MKKTIRDPFTYYFPELDLHGEYTTTITYLIYDFINDNFKLRKKQIKIVHGKGSGALKKKTHELLKSHPKVISFYIDPYNEGCTIVELNVD